MTALSPGASPPPVEIAIRITEEMDRVVGSGHHNLSRRHAFMTWGTPRRQLDGVARMMAAKFG
jgi:hypothetical protein